MSVFIYHNSVSGLRMEIEQSNINKLKQIENMTNERMNEFEKITFRISHDPRLTPYMMSHDYYSGEAREELKKYKDNSSIIEEIFVYFYDNENYIYSSNGLSSLDTLTQKMYQFKKWEKEDLVSDLYTTKAMIKPAGDVTLNKSVHDRIIAFLYPIAPNNPQPYGTVMYFVEETVLTNLIENILGDYQGNTYILDENSHMIVSAMNDQKIELDNLDESILNTQGVNKIQLKGKEYSVVSVKSEVSGWTFFTIMNTNQFFERVVHMETFIVLLLISLLLLGFVIAFLFGQKQYKPIQSLFELTKMNDRKDTVLDGKNEIESIRNRITSIYKDHKSITETLDLQMPYAKEKLLAKLLKGDFQNNSEIYSMLHALNIKMNDGFYFVAIIELAEVGCEEEYIKKREHLINLLSEISFSNATAYGVDLLYNDAIALIININKKTENVKKERRIFARQIQQYIKKTSLTDPLIVAVGTIYDKKSFINRSYIEALATMEYKLSVPQGSIVYFEELGSSTEKSLGYPKEDQIKLAQSLKQGDQVVAIETLQNIFASLGKTELSIHVLKCICFDITNTVIKTGIELGMTEDFGDFKGIADFNSVEQLNNRLTTVILQICKKVEAKKESHNEKLRIGIMDYIDSHYKEYGLSLEVIATKFELSIPYLSKFIKEQTGETFTQYVVKLRMSEVKKQLRETDKTIEKIIMNVGYKDVANFTRKFKQIEGVPPGQYRKLNRS